MNNIKIAVSSKRFGAIKQNGKLQSEHLKTFLDEFHINPEAVVFMKQIHGNSVELVQHRKPIIDETDGIVTKQKHMYLGVSTADCVPVLLFDREHEIIGAVHAGYKGILLGIVENAIEKFLQNGAYSSHIQGILGPSIGVCCYHVDEDRAKIFQEKFGHDIIEERNGKSFVNLAGVVIKILTEKGIKPEHIFNSDICTSCHSDEYFSYRKQDPQNFGTFVSMIGME